jgi:hypothetical protein
MATKAGNLKFRAESAQVAFAQNVVSLSRVTIREPDGRLLASAREVLISGAVPNHLSGPPVPIHAYASNVYARIERQRDGKFTLENYIPVTPPTESNQPYSIDAKHVQALLEDYGGGTLWQSHANSTEIRVDGVGQRWIASGAAEVTNIGKVTAQIRKDPDQGLDIEGDATRVDLAPLLKHVTGIPDSNKFPVLRDIRVTRLILSGPVRLFIPDHGTAEYEANVVADATELSYRNDFNIPTGHFEGVLTHSGLKGTLNASGLGISANYSGALSWGHEAVLGGALQAKVDRIEHAPQWLQRFLPTGMTFNDGVFNGWLSYSQRGSIAVDGSFQASNAQYRGEQLSEPRLDINASPDRVAINLSSATWDQSPFHGAINFTPKTRVIEGLLIADHVALDTVAKRFGISNLQGTTDVQALITGNATTPLVSVRATGTARTRAHGRNYNLGEIVAAANYANGFLNVTRLSVRGPDGTATATGTWNQKTNAISADLVGSNIPLSALTADVQGQASFIGKVAGTVKAPTANGRVEVYAGQYQNVEVPLVIADVHATRSELVASNFQAFQNAAHVAGTGTLDLRTQAVSGTATAEDVQLSDYLGDKVAGIISVPKATIGGTLKHLEFTGSFNGTNIVAEGIKVDTVSAVATLKDKQAQLTALNATFDQGKIDATASYDLTGHQGKFNGNATGMGLSLLASKLPNDTTLDGLLTGSFSGQINHGGIQAAELHGNVQDVLVDNVFLGAGPVSIEDAAGQWKASGTVGQLDRYFSLDQATYNNDTKQVHADVAAHNLTLQNAYSVARNYVASETDPADVKAKAAVVLPQKVLDRLQGVAGSVDAALTIDGKSTNPDVDIPTLLVSGVQIGGEKSGTVTAQATRKNSIWDIPSLTWTGGPGSLSAHGTIAEHGDTNFSGTVTDLNSQWLALFEPPANQFTGTGLLTFAATGPTKSPTIDTDLSYLEGKDTSPDRRQLNVKGTIQEGKIEAAGDYYYKGFAGTLTAQVPFEYPFTIPKDEPLTASLSLPSRSLQDLTALLPDLDPRRTSGTLSGDLTVHGPIGALKVTGGATVSAPRVAMNKVDTTLDNVTAKATFNGTTLALNATGTGSQGGTVSISNAKIELGDASGALQQSLEALLANPVAGTITIEKLKVVQKGSVPINATFGGTVNLSGPLQETLFAGKLSVTEGTISIPSIQSSSEGPFEPRVNPKFNIALEMPNPILLNAGLGNFQLTGAGTLGGSLALPDLNAELLVEKGTIRLPNARINIDPGGTIHIFYAATPYGAPDAHTNLDLTGTTALTANPYSGTVQRYDIDLQIRGDLLAQNGLQISAQSDPPDLSQGTILGLLGQGGLFGAQQNGVAEPFRADQQLTSVFYSTLPLLFDPFTQHVATGLGLDYLSIEYNAYEHVAITAAKSLNKNLVLSGRREISEPLPGQRLLWDVRLSYRLPFKSKRLRNLNFNIGADQDRPWRVGLEYGFRF